MYLAEFQAIEEDKVAFPEARIVKFQELFDYYDAKDFLIKYMKTGNRNNLVKATYALLGLWMQLKVEFKINDFKLNKYKDVNKLDYFFLHKDKMPSFALCLKFFFALQNKLKDIKVLDITFPESNIARDFQRSF
jgi:hypothetical protein